MKYSKIKLYDIKQNNIKSVKKWTRKMSLKIENEEEMRI